MSNRLSRCLFVLAATSLSSIGASSIFAAVEPVTLNWLGDAAPRKPANVTWGVPWPKGGVPAGTAMRLATADGRRLEMETWPLAYWPDGSLKWTGITIDTGRVRARVALEGGTFIGSLSIDGRVVGRDGRLIAIREDRAEYESRGILREQRSVSHVSQVVLEHSGPLRTADWEANYLKDQ